MTFFFVKTPSLAKCKTRFIYNIESAIKAEGLIPITETPQKNIVVLVSRNRLTFKVRVGVENRRAFPSISV